MRMQKPTPACYNILDAELIYLSREHPWHGELPSNIHAYWLHPKRHATSRDRDWSRELGHICHVAMHSWRHRVLHVSHVEAPHETSLRRHAAE
jgi:hypothetical protein